MASYCLSLTSMVESVWINLKKFETNSMRLSVLIHGVTYKCVIVHGGKRYLTQETKKNRGIYNLRRVDVTNRDHNNKRHSKNKNAFT
jgi:hypothetical protein